MTTWFGSAALVVCACIIPASVVRAAEIDEAKAIKVRAAYLYNFAKFIEWPAESFAREDGPFVIGVLNDEPFARALGDTVKRKKLKGRRVEIRRLSWAKAADRTRVKDCHAIYVGAGLSSKLPDILARIKPHSVLAVSHVAGFARDGGMIGFVHEKGRIVFEINLEVVEEALLKVSSRLLKLAKVVAGGSD